MTSFLGEYESTIDAKGRFVMPIGFKKQLAENENSFIINRGFEKCLCLYTQENWKPVYAKISALNDFIVKERQFRRNFLGGATNIEFDSAGRLLLPVQLKEYAFLQKDIILVAAVEKIEIWDLETYKKFFDNFSPEDYSDISQDVMANK